MPLASAGHTRNVFERLRLKDAFLRRKFEYGIIRNIQ